MIIKANERTIAVDKEPMGGTGEIHLDKLFSFDGAPANVRVYSKACLNPGSGTGYHVHNGESETYFILSGEGEYNDNGEIVTVKKGDVTYTPSGCGHCLKNAGNEPLEFMALIVLD